MSPPASPAPQQTEQPAPFVQDQTPPRATTGSPTASPRAPAPAEPSRRTAQVPQPERKPRPPAREAAAAKPEPASLPSAAVPTPASGDPLIGLDPAAATAMLGPPAESEEHPPATVWRYRGGGCGLELVFYFDSRSGKLRSIRDDLRGAGGDPEKRKACLAAIAQAGRAGNPSPH
ncbi:MAG TPA: hypothetical protein VFA12_12725 [Stellaceae bacterium]|nr:hypothetical protein [Stellaceae bacterium]